MWKKHNNVTSSTYDFYSAANDEWRNDGVFTLVKWRRCMSNGHDTISMLWDMMSYFAKLTGEDLSRDLNKIESIGLRKA